MKLKTNITEEREIDITLPIFRKEDYNGCLSYIAVIEESHAIKLYINDKAGHVQVLLTPMWLMTTDVMKAVQSWQEVTEEEFLNAHDKALQSLSLAPVLCEIDQEIENELTDNNDLKDVL
jgi:hypothetical protein